MNTRLADLRDDLRQLPAWAAVLLATAALLVLGVKTLGTVAAMVGHAVAVLLVLVAVLAEWLEAVAADYAGIEPLSSYAAPVGPRADWTPGGGGD